MSALFFVVTKLAGFGQALVGLHVYPQADAEHPPHIARNVGH